MCRFLATFVVVLVVVPLAGCPGGSGTGEPLNPFRDLPAVDLDGRPHALLYTIAPLGPLAQDQVIRLKVAGEGVQEVLILAKDPQSDEDGVLAGGGPPNTSFDYRVQIAGECFVFVLFDEQASEAFPGATLTAGPGDPGFAPPKTQPVLVAFEEGFLTNPGLVDPVSFTEAERQVLVDITPAVRQGIIDRLRAVFAGTPIEILQEGDPLPAGPLSRVTFLGRRELAEGDAVFFDSIIPPLAAEHSECQDRVVFGEMLPRGTLVDPGNHVPDDQAVVYVGSFQGRGEACRSAAINSGNNIVLGLAHTAAHEIGHLVGLYHVSLTDIMDRSPTLAFQRELSFDRGQLVIESPTGSTLLTSVIQDPGFYLRANFSK